MVLFRREQTRRPTIPENRHAPRSGLEHLAVDPIDLDVLRLRYRRAASDAARPGAGFETIATIPNIGCVDYALSRTVGGRMKLIRAFARQHANVEYLVDGRTSPAVESQGTKCRAVEMRCAA